MDKQKILETLNKESFSEISSNKNRVIIEDDFEIIADEIVRLFAIPNAIKTFNEKQMDDAYDKGFTDGYEHAKDGY